MIKPFLKWAGGKRWLIARYPALFNRPFKRYVEPFLGSGAVFFHIAPRRSYISDINANLINLYACIRDKHERVHSLLKTHARLHSNRYYYHLRDKHFRSPYARAAQFLYLNRTCWNGLYRENRQGRFNVPRGTKNTILFGDDDFASIADVLKTAVISSCDFEDVLAQTRLGDFVFVDPPYTVRHNSNGFIRYNEKLFSWADQLRLARVLRQKASSGANFLMTNAYHSSVFDLYADFATIIPAGRVSILSADSRNRGPTKEALVLIGDGWNAVTEELSLASRAKSYSGGR